MLVGRAPLLNMNKELIRKQSKTIRDTMSERIKYFGNSESNSFTFLDIMISNLSSERMVSLYGVTSGIGLSFLIPTDEVPSGFKQGDFFEWEDEIRTAVGFEKDAVSGFTRIDLAHKYA